jgi:hypothetical protein
MVINMKETGPMTKRMEKEFILISFQENSILELGKME